LRGIAHRDRKLWSQEKLATKNQKTCTFKKIIMKDQKSDGEKEAEKEK
jgi:hypothetical protein